MGIPELELFVLGHLRLLLNGQPLVELVSAKAQALLVYLILTGETYARTALAGLFWGEFPEETARANLRQTLTKLRKTVGDYLVISWETVAFNRALPFRVDALEFVALTEAARAHRHRHATICSSCADRLRQAVGLYRDDLLRDLQLPDCPDFELWMVGRREHLHQLALDALDQLGAYELRRANYAQAQAYARRQIALDPFRESARRQLMRAMALAGQRPAALSHYQSFVRELQHELDAEPEPATRRLYEEIKSGALAAPSAPTHPLPVPASPFFGRAGELAYLREQFEGPDCRLLTLVGPGGVGKTRLALEAAAQMAGYFEDGQFLVQLARVDTPTLVVGAIAQALGVKDTGGSPLSEKVAAYLRPREVLLVIDNCEHVIESLAVLGDLLASCPRLAVLATSREPLRLTGEYEYPVPPLSTPAADQDRAAPGEALLRSEAVQLFLQRARAIMPGLDFSPVETTMVAEICRRLDGLPLAIELAAGQVRHLRLEAMFRRMSQAPMSSLGLLTGGARDMLPRQRTMRDTIAWSYTLLEEPGRHLFRRLAVFRGGWTVESSDQVCAASAEDALAAPMIERPADVMLALAGKNLLQLLDPTAPQRYGFLEVIREFAFEQLSQSGEELLLRRRHALFFMNLVEEVEVQLRGADQQSALARLDAEYDNVRVALSWTIEAREAEIAQRIAGTLWRYWEIRGYLGEGRRWVEAALALDGEVPDRYRARAYNTLGLVIWFHGGGMQARPWFEQSLALRRAIGDATLIADVLNNLGMVAWGVGDYALSHQMYEECLAIDRALNDRAYMAYSLGNVGLTLHHQGDAAGAQAMCEEALVIFRETGNRQHEAYSLHNLGMVIYHTGDLPGARARYEASIAIKTELGDYRSVSSTQLYLAQVLREQGDLAGARALLGQSLALRREHDDRAGQVETIEGLAAYAAAAGRGEQAATLFGAALQLRESLESFIHAADRRERDRQIAAARRLLAAADFAEAWAAGQRLSLEEATALAERLTQ